MKERKRKIRREIARRLKALLSRMELLPRELRPYQVEALQAVIRWLEDPKGTARAYIEHATGLGKTELFAAIVSACVGLRALIVVPTKTLIEQTARRVVAYTGGILGHLSSLGPIKDEGGVIIAIRGHEFCDILITTDESFKRHGRFLAEKFAPHLVIRDECHGSYSEPEQAITDYFSDAVILGFTATPDYLGTIVKESYAPVTLDNGRVLYAPPDRIARAHYGTCLDQRTVRWGIEEGYLAPLAWGHIEFDVSLDEVGIADSGEAGLDYNDTQLQTLLRKHWQFMVDTIVQLYKRGEYDLPNRQVFAVCANVREAQQIANALKEAGYPAACITGKTRDKERESILKKFKAGEIKFLSSVMVLREGWDAPNAEVCLMLRPTRSRVLYMQSMGRVLRTMPDGTFKCALVIDAYFLNTKFAPLSAPVLFGLPGQTVEDGGILVGPKDGYVPIPTQSPYQRPGVKPKVIVVPADYDLEYWLGEDGTVEIEGETWSMRDGFAVMLNISNTALEGRLDATCRTRPGRSRNGLRVTLYALSDVKRVCADLLDKERLQVGDNGTVEADGDTWGTRKCLAKVLGITDPKAIDERLDDTCRTRPGKTQTGQPRTLYALSDVKRVCADLLDKERLQVGDNGTVEADGDTWGMYEDLATVLGISGHAVSDRLDDTCRTRKGVGRPPKIHKGKRAGRPVTLYALSDVKRVCADLLDKERLQVGDNGTVEADGDTWGIKEALAKIVDVFVPSLTSRLDDTCRTRPGKDACGRPITLYALSDVKRVCANIRRRKRGVINRRR